jgi:hypothetical protein
MNVWSGLPDRTSRLRQGYGSRGDCRSLFTLLFQEEIHAIEIDYGMTVVQRVHAENATDSRAALP